MKKSQFVFQQGETDCGPAALLSIIRIFGGNNNLENLRNLSGTDITGTSLLGMVQACEKLGLNAEAFQVNNIDEFNGNASLPCILHVSNGHYMNHYVVCLNLPTAKYPYYKFFDPALGLCKWNLDTLNQRWISKAVLFFQPNEHFGKLNSKSFNKIQFIHNLLKSDYSYFSIIAVMGIILAHLGLATAVFSQKLVDDILPKHNLEKLYWTLPLFLFISIMKSCIDFLRNYFLIKQTKRSNNRIYNTFYDRILDLNYNFFKSRNVGEIISRINDSRSVQQAIQLFMGNFIIDIFVFIISVIFIFFTSPLIGCFALCSVPLFILLVLVFNKNIITSQKEAMVSSAHLESHFINTISGISAIKSLNAEPFFKSKAKDIYENFHQKTFNLSKIGTMYGFFGELISFFLLTIIIGLSSYYVVNSNLSIGKMIAIISIGSNLISIIGRLSLSNLRFQEAKLALERMFELTIPEWDNGHKSSLNLNELEFNTLSVDSLSFGFPGKDILLSDITFKVQKGTITYILGEIGVGKSILLQIFHKWQKVEIGNIFIDGKNINNVSIKYWQKYVGLIPQEVEIFNDTVFGNIIMGDTIFTEKAIVEYCNLVGVNRYFEALPNSYFTQIGDNGVKLSGGQKQLLGLVRILIRKPKILLLDEPTSSMDEKTEKIMFSILENLKQNMLILIVTHRKSFISESDKILLLKNKTIKPIEKLLLE